MFKNLLLTLVLLPFLCFAQYEWTDKGDYKILEYSDYIRQVGFSISGDSLMITGDQKISIFDLNGNHINTIQNVIEDFNKTLSFSTDMKSYILHDAKAYYDYAEIIRSVYSFKNNTLIAKDTINISISKPPRYSDQNIRLVEYSSKYKKFYTISSSSYTPYHSNYSYRGEHTYRFSNSMNLYFYKRSEETITGDIQQFHDRTNYNEQIIYNNSNNDTVNYYFKNEESLYYGNKIQNSKVETEGKYHHDAAFAKDENLIVLANRDTLFLYTLNPFEKIQTFSIGFVPQYFEFSNDNNYLFVLSPFYLFSLNLSTGQLDNLIKFDEIRFMSESCSISTHPNDFSKIALYSKNNLVLIDTDLESMLKADFTTNKTLYQTIDTIQFHNNSKGMNLEYLWEFGDGNTSNEKNPKHLYSEPGTYSIRLSVTNQNGTHIEYKKDYIKVVEQQLFADFNYYFSATSLPVGLNLYGFSESNYNYSKWIVMGEVIDENKDTTTCLIYEPGQCIVSFYIKDSKTGFYDIKTDTIEINLTHKKIDNLVNEKIISTNHKLKTYNILEYEDDYYLNFVYDSVDIGKVSEIYKMDKEYNYNRQMKFQGYSYPPYEPVIYNDNFVFKYDSSLKMNDLSYLGTDFEGNTKFNYSQKFGKNGSLEYPEHQINTTKLKVYNDSLYVLGTYGYGFGYVGKDGNEYESAKSYLYKVNSADYNPIQIDSLIYKRNYDTDFFIDTNLKIFSYLNYYDVMNSLNYFHHCIKNNNDGLIISTTGRRKNFPRIYDNYFNENHIFSTFKDKMVYINITNGSTLFNYGLSENSTSNSIIRKGDYLYIAGSNNNEAAFYIYNFKTSEIDSVVLENRIGEFTDLCFNDKGNLMLFGKLNNNLNDKIYIAEYDFDLTDNTKDSIVVDPPTEPGDTTDISGSIEYYPNPAAEELLIKYMSEDNEPIEIHVLDMTGREFFAATINAVEGENDYYLQIDHIAPGVYLLNIQTPSGIISRKFVKE